MPAAWKLPNRNGWHESYSEASRFSTPGLPRRLSAAPAARKAQAVYPAACPLPRYSVAVPNRSLWTFFVDDPSLALVIAQHFSSPVVLTVLLPGGMGLNGGATLK